MKQWTDYAVIWECRYQVPVLKVWFGFFSLKPVVSFRAEKSIYHRVPFWEFQLPSLTLGSWES